MYCDFHNWPLRSEINALGGSNGRPNGCSHCLSVFSVFFKHWGNEISDEDSRILRAIRSELEAVVKERNRIMHDAWMGKTVGGESGPHALSRLRTRAHGRGIDFESVDMPPDVLNEFGSNIERLAKLIFAIVFYARPGQIGPEVHQRFEIVDGKVLEKASE